MEGECPTPDNPHRGTRRIPPAPSCRPHGAEGQLARACGVGLVKEPQSRNPRTQVKGAAGPNRTPQSQAVGAGRVPKCGHPSQRHESPPRRHPPAGPTVRNASCQERALWGTHPPTSDPRAEEKRATGPGRTPPGRTGGGGRVPKPRHLPQRLEVPCPPGGLLPPPQCTTPARQGVRCGVGDKLPHPHPPHANKKAQLAPAARPKVGRSGEGECPTPDTPHRGTRRSPQGAPLLPSRHAKPAVKSVRFGVGEGFPRSHPLRRRRTGSGPQPHA